MAHPSNATSVLPPAQWLLVASGDLKRAEEVGARHLEEARLLGTHTQIHAHRGEVELGLGRGDLNAVLGTTEDLLDLVDAGGGRVCDHGGVALSGRALALTEKGLPEGLDLFGRFAELANPSALFSAQFGNLERWRPFLGVEQAEEELNGLGPPSTVYQNVARCWIVLLAVSAWTGSDPLTDREREVLREVGEGHPNIEIAQRLHLAEGTVRNYLSSAIVKLGARNRTEAFAKAQGMGYL